jgi:hypothetical protein
MYLVGFSFVFDICGFYDYTHAAVTTSCSQRTVAGGTNIIYGSLSVAWFNCIHKHFIIIMFIFPFSNQALVIDSLVDQTFTTTMIPLKFKSFKKINKSITCRFRRKFKNMQFIYRKIRIQPKKNCNSSLDSSQKWSSNGNIYSFISTVLEVIILF